jgi:alpha-glucosidase (family GH31 glycosyl hydrolase)
MGYPYTCPDLIGGGEYLSFSNLETIDQELIVRAAQCHALMPMMQFSVAPWRVLNKKNLDICVQMARLHVQMGDEILTLAKEAAGTGEPIIRSMEYVFPGNDYADITDQFLLGDRILVAPVTEKGAVSREIVFPVGKWAGDDGSLVEGPVTLVVAAPIERLPWYRRIE